MCLGLMNLGDVKFGATVEEGSISLTLAAALEAVEWLPLRSQEGQKAGL